MEQLAGRCKGYFLFGENPAVGSANARMQRLGMANLDWMVVRDLGLIDVPLDLLYSTEAVVVGLMLYMLLSRQGFESEHIDDGQ